MLPHKIAEIQKGAGFIETLRRDIDTITRSIHGLLYGKPNSTLPAQRRMHRRTSGMQCLAPYTNKRLLRFKLNLSFAESGV